MAVVYHRGGPSDRPSGTRRPTPGRLTACPREANLGKAPLPALRRRRRHRLCSRRPATGTVPPPHRRTAAREVEGLDIDAYRFLSLIHISEPTRRTPISYAVFCLKKK